jgi:hypothetical protein
MCLTGSALSVEEYAKKVNLKDVAKGKQPVGTILAWRTWNIDGVIDLRPKLRSASASAIWTPGKVMDAHAEIKKDTDHVGVHAYKTIKDMVAGQNPSKTDYTQTKVVVGQVLLWGKIAEHSNGYRAEHGYPFLLYANGPALQVRLSEIYGCHFSRDFIPRLLEAA